jgi:chromosomal replication initiator protein
MKRRKFIHTISAGVLLGVYSQSKSILAATNTVASPGEGTENPHIASPGFLIENELAKNYTFKQFVEGKSNRPARHAALHISENRWSYRTPVFIHSPTGLGKTHLLHAIGNGINANNPNTNFLQIHTMQFVAEMKRAMQQKQTDEFKAFFLRLDVLLIDDIEFVAGKERSQRELSAILDAMVNNHKQIVITGHTSPQEIERINEPLKFILGSGVTLAIDSTELETRIEILKRKARQFDYELSDDVALFIADNRFASVRKLEAVLRRIVTHSHLEGKNMTVDSTRRVLVEHGFTQLQEVV